MITVLWTMTVASVIALAAALNGRTAAQSAANRVELERAYWVAMGCARRIQAGIDELLRDAPTPDDAAAIWRVLDRRTRPTTELTAAQCDARMEAAGSRIDVNEASVEVLTRLWGALGLDDDQATTITAALLAMRANRPIADVQELRGVSDLPGIARLDSVLTTEPGRISLATASEPVLRAVPGFTSETAQLIARLNAEGTPLRDPLELAAQLSAESRAALMARYDDVARVSTTNPDAWVLTTRAWSGRPESSVVLQWRIGRAGTRCLILASRTTL